MYLALMLAFQTVAAPVSPPEQAIRPIDFDLAQYQSSENAPPETCANGDPNVVVVCGRRRGRGAYPLAEMARLFEPGRIVAEMRLTGNLSGNVHVESAPGDRGAVANRVMIGLKLPF